MYTFIEEILHKCDFTGSYLLTITFPIKSNSKQIGLEIRANFWCAVAAQESASLTKDIVSDDILLSFDIIIIIF